MKPITGEEVSSKPVSLSMAAIVLSKFLDTDTGADDEMLAYLRRASMAFDELVHFHREIDSRRGSSEKVDAGDDKKKKKKDRGGSQIEGGEGNDRSCSKTEREESARVDIEVKNEKNKKRKMIDGGSVKHQHKNMSRKKMRDEKQIPVVKTCSEEDREEIVGFHAKVKKKKRHHQKINE
ncbi:hypothetical protein ZOSMA_44G01570 [Zostera marina]|uniref:Uncharacterized protein n=1 Tax=Zostera marina TaxID=29655 RepID=A0A0K9P1A1_ZOSMR|nr:hypothetical protein ZOSMA_44G01570 [Zostera marina]